MEKLTNPIRVLIVDDHPTLRSGLIALIQRQPDLTIVGEASNGLDAVAKAQALSPNVVMMDLVLPKMSGMEAITQIHASCPEIRILVFSSFCDGEQILAAMQAGAIGYLGKDSAPEEIFQAIRMANTGQPALTMQTQLTLLQQIQHNRPADLPVDKLTEREIEILCWMAQGLSNADIAQKACIAEGTVRSHVSNLLAKLGLTNRAQAVIYAVRTGLINIDPK